MLGHFVLSFLKEASVSNHTCSHQDSNLMNGIAEWSDLEVGTTYHKLFLSSVFYKIRGHIKLEETS